MHVISFGIQCRSEISKEQRSEVSHICKVVVEAIRIISFILSQMHTSKAINVGVLGGVECVIGGLVIECIIRGPSRLRQTTCGDGTTYPRAHPHFFGARLLHLSGE
jgi:hypothetical protein